MTEAASRRTGSNSYNWVPVRDIPRNPGEPCPLASADCDAAAYDVMDRGQRLLLRLRDRMRLFRTDTRDFTQEGLVDVKERLGQLYLDVSSKLAPDDFSKDLRKLQIDAECTACWRRGGCAGAWHAVSGDVFAEDDGRVLSILDGMAGAILDVGCGEGRYVESFERAVLGARARYVGLDPDRARVKLLESRYPWALYEVGTLSEFFAREPLVRGPFDHVLFLRSYNHLPDPGAAMAAALALLRVGGTLLLVDNVAFGLVRTREQATRAQAGPAGFEHYRNDSAHDAHARLAGKPVELIERRDVGPATSNQWFLRYRKIAEVG